MKEKRKNPEKIYLRGGFLLYKLPVDYVRTDKELIVQDSTN
jgi:hypothetical protein